jgi:LemA protein
MFAGSAGRIRFQEDRPVTLELWIVLVPAVALGAYGIWAFNRLVALRAEARSSWSDIDVQLKRRWDLIPDLVQTTRGYARHESETLERALAARSAATRADSVPGRGRAEGELGESAARLIALAEAYPDLKADNVFLSLQEQLVDTENRLQSARRYYNAVVRDTNTFLQQFPHSIVARGSGFSPFDYFELEDRSEESVPDVELGVPGSGP